MAKAEQKNGDDINIIGEVRWGFKHSGYVSGLEGLGDKIDLYGQFGFNPDNFTKPDWMK